MNYNTCKKSFAKNAVLISDLLDQAAEALPEKTLFKDSSGRTISYGQAKQIVDDLAIGLCLEGYKTGDRICLIGTKNSSNWCICYLAILKIGAVVVPLDSSLKVEELAILLKDCEASGVISSDSKLNSFERLKPDLPSLKNIFLLDCFGSNRSSSLYHLIVRGQSQTTTYPHINPKSLAVLIYTSGTTGRPKGVMLSHENIISDLKAIQKRLIFSTNDVILSVMPLHHTFECTCGFLNSISLGLKIVFARSYKSNQLLEDIRENEVSYMCAVPLLYEKMYRSMKRKINNSRWARKLIFAILFSVSRLGRRFNHNWGKRVFRSLRKNVGIDSLHMLVSGGTALPKNVSHFFDALGIPLLQGYGLSETSPVISVNSPQHNRFASVGKPLESVEVRIEKTNEDLEGEIIVRGPMVMLGYYNNGYDTAKVLANEWFFTGDLGYLDKDGFLYITGRSKNVIVSAAGKNIHPEEIEALLCESSYILEALVLGRKIRDSNIEEITAVIVPDTGAIQGVQGYEPSSKKQLIGDIIQAEVSSVCSRLADFKRIEKYYICQDGLPKTTTNKLKRCLEIDENGRLIEKRSIKMN